MVQRVKVMSFSEVFYRFKLELHKWWWKKRIPSYNVSLKSNISLKYPIQPQKNYPEQNKLIEEAEHYMVHHWLFFGLDCREEMIDWHKDPVSNLSAPITFGFSINHRNEHLVGNIKNIWEKNRHHHLTVLGMAFFLTREERYAKEIKDQLRSWIEQNPYLIGVNWTHPLEQGIRLIAWSYLFILLKGSQYFDEIFSKDGFLWKSVYEHQKFIIKTYSVGSSANNHLIGEMAGLFISTCYFPIFKESAKWKKFAQQKLEKELYRQTYVSGINKELAFSYQIFVIEFCLLTVIADNQAFSEKYRNILKNMLQFVDKVESTVGFLPNYGDGDEGMAVQLQSMDSSRSDWLFDLSNKFLRTSFSDRGSFLAQLFECRHAEAKPIQPSSYIYEDAGLLIYHDKNANHSYAGLFDFGPLGMRGLAAHGHADALSFTLAIDKQPFIIDPGTYCYHTDLYWREYFRSVHAHNALSIYGQDQSTQAGPFLWSRKANAKLLSFDLNKKKIKATEDGYSSLGVGHIREFTWGDGRIEIRDELIGGGKYQLDIRFHFHPDVEINFDKILVICQMGIIKVIIKPDESLHAKLIAGSDDGGWYSPKFGIKNRTNTLVLNGVISLPASISNKIILE
ncbi:MAG: alginate lyase family protein [Bacteroidota bacterium]